MHGIHEKAVLEAEDEDHEERKEDAARMEKRKKSANTGNAQNMICLEKWGYVMKNDVVCPGGSAAVLGACLIEESAALDGDDGYADGDGPD